MKRIRGTLLMLFTAQLFGCSSASKVNVADAQKNHSDVLLLSILIRDHFQNTEMGDRSLEGLMKRDSAGRISANFEKVELEQHVGYIGVRYKFSRSRNAAIELTEKEKKSISYLRVAEKESPDGYDGQIRFGYPERFYPIRTIFLYKKQ